MLTARRELKRRIDALRRIPLVAGCTTAELAGPLKAAMLETGRALWRYRVALHEAALTALRTEQ